MAFEDMTPDEQERVIIAELMGRVELFAETGRSSMPIRLDEMAVLLKHAVAAVLTRCPHAWEEVNPGHWMCKELCGIPEVDLTRSPDWSPQRPDVDREALTQALADEVLAWPADAGLPHHPDDSKVVLTFRRLADAVLPLLAETGSDANADAACKHPLGFTILRMTVMCCSDCGAATPGRCICGALYRTPQCQNRAHLHGPALAGSNS